MLETRGLIGINFKRTISWAMQSIHIKTEQTSSNGFLIRCTLFHFRILLVCRKKSVACGNSGILNGAWCAQTQNN